MPERSKGGSGLSMCTRASPMSFFSLKHLWFRFLSDTEHRGVFVSNMLMTIFGTLKLEKSICTINHGSRKSKSLFYLAFDQEYSFSIRRAQHLLGFSKKRSR